MPFDGVLAAAPGIDDHRHADGVRHLGDGLISLGKFPSTSCQETVAAGAYPAAERGQETNAFQTQIFSDPLPLFIAFFAEPFVYAAS